VDGHAEFDGSGPDPPEPGLSSFDRSARIVACAAPGQERAAPANAMRLTAPRLSGGEETSDPAPNVTP
jgi:hypothetical protein